MSLSKMDRLRMVLSDDDFPAPPPDSAGVTIHKYPDMSRDDTTNRYSSDDESVCFTGRTPFHTPEIPKKIIRQSPSPPQQTITEERASQVMASLSIFEKIPDHPDGPRPLVGTLAKTGESFCPILAIAKFPYRFVRNKTISEAIADAYWNSGKFWRLSWDLYYARTPSTHDTKPLLLVSIDQVINLFDKVNKSVDGAHLSLSAASTEPGLVLTFGQENPKLRPRYLGCSTSQEQFKTLERRVPSRNYRPLSEPETTAEPKEQDVTLFARMIESGLDTCKARNRNKTVRQEHRLSLEQDWRHELRQTERFLGLRPASFQAKLPDTEIEQTWEEVQAREAAKIEATNIEPIKITATPPFPFESNIVFICIDVESWEKDKRKITEIGVSTLDTFDLAGICPGEDGKNWREKISSRHLRIKENSYLENCLYVSSCPAGFRFGQSEFISQKDAAQVLETCFNPPYPDSHRSAEQNPENDINIGKRQVVVVGHDVGNDIRYLASLGFHVTEVKNLHRKQSIIDTQGLWRALKSKTDPDSLANVIQSFDITPWGLHNAGNDAAYTMQVLLGIAVRSASERGRKTLAKKEIGDTGAEDTETSDWNVAPSLW